MPTTEMGHPLPAESRPRLTSKAMLKTDKVTGGRMLLYPEGALALNSTGAAIVDLCDGQRTFGELVTSLAAKFNAPVEMLTPDVSEYIGQLRERGLVELVGMETP